MSILSAIKSYLATYEGLEDGAPIWVDWLGANPIEYAIVPQPGEKILEEYIDGGSLRAYPFAVQCAVSTADDLTRLQNNEFFEALSDWMESQTEVGNLPTLGANQAAQAIEAINWAFLYEEGQSDTGIYMIQCQLTYKQAP
jgi:hypothetical protein